MANFSRLMLVTVGITLLSVVIAASSAAALTQDEISNLTGANRQSTLEDGAKKEGGLSYYCTLRVDSGCRPLTAAFQKKYPFLKTEYVSLASEGILQRALAESRAKSVHVDVMLASVADSLKGTGIPQKFSSPEFAAYDPRLIDPNGMWVSFRTSWNGIAWNTNLIKQGEGPQTWEALADPKYKGKLFWASGSASGAPRVITHFRAMWGDDKTIEFLKKLQAQDVRTAPGNSGAVMAGITAGEFPIMIGHPIDQVATDMLTGAPVGGVNPDPALARTSALALLAGAPHPHAAMLFIDYILSKEGQQVVSDIGYNPTRPGVNLNPDLQWLRPDINGKKEILLPTETENQMNDKSVEIYQSMFR